MPLRPNFWKLTLEFRTSVKSLWQCIQLPDQEEALNTMRLLQSWQ